MIASFPAAGAGRGFRWLTGRDHVACANASSVDDLSSGRWEHDTTKEIVRTAAEVSARHVVLVGHSMGGLSALRLSGELGPALGVPVGVLLLNTPCPDSTGRIPTMSRSSDTEIADVLAGDGFPPEVLADPELLAEVAAGVRTDAEVADRLAEWVNSTADVDRLHVVTTRGDFFIGMERCARWRGRVTTEFVLVEAEGSHMLDGTPPEVLHAAVDSVVASLGDIG
ncbi:alpha/beta fold hydrolase [Umezawaea sp. Da 62-37]|uniref:alpha/beta fold hydrolase n=1 Tax=Umezawaea sp. Da 62-37 TaxID=3075927 RepID=UPI0028F744BB|nr:alpha/beta fold hydrolase [Umezawaea sp. Da 62-37]WNV87533.1 alpha/beta fold hydrolase [Umezawaea sp. Da 62-37]